MAPIDIFAAIGLGTPFYFAAATYGFFFWLDRNASAQANRAISGWLKGQPHARIDVSSAIIAAFDRVYTWPLLRKRAFIRSVTFSTFAWIAWTTYIGVHMNSNPKISKMIEEVYQKVPLYAIIFEIFMTFPIVAISDYLSLFIVRKFLSFRYPSLSLLCGIISGFVTIYLVVLGVRGLQRVVYYLFNALIGDGETYIPSFSTSLRIEALLQLTVNSAFLVHIWLLLFALGALGVRFLYPFCRAVERAQWFIKQGNQHPLRAIGMVAGVLVFAGTAVARLVASVT